MQSCFEEQLQSSHTPLFRRPDTISPPEPGQEPMQVDSTRLSHSERQRRLTLGLCLYCGAEGHGIATCPIRPPRPMVSVIKPAILNMQPLTSIVNLTASGVSLSVQALLDSGSARNLISGNLCRQLKLSTTPTKTIYQVQSVTGKPLSHKHVRHSVGPLHLRVEQLHEETLHLLVLEDSTADVILGRPWFVQHDPIISWKTGEFLKWGSPCFPDCFPHIPQPSSLQPVTLPVNSTSIESPVDKQSVDIPTCYAPFSDVFCPKKASQLPPHRPWDCAIDLLPGEPVPHGKIYPLSLPEQKAMEEYIEEALQQGYIRPSTSPAASSFFPYGQKGRRFEALHRLPNAEQSNSQVPLSTSPRPSGIGTSPRSHCLQVRPPQRV